jgi:nucleotide sugar dehydrogenase
MERSENMRFCVIGLGYVGLTLAIHLVRKGFRVDGVDVSDRVIGALSEGRAHFYEKNFDTEVKKALDSGRFIFGKSIVPYDGTTVYVVTVGTPLGDNGKVNLNPIQEASKSISRVLQNGDCIILRSTVRLGVSRNSVKPILDASGKKYFMGFCPERTVEGKALEELENLPQIVSGIDEQSTKKIVEIFSRISREVVVMNSLEEAEMVKLVNNSERDLMFALANEIALMCDAIGLNAHKIIDAANYNYPRSQLKRPGPVGGPCLEKDPYILTEVFFGEKYIPKLFKIGREVNESIMALAFNIFADIYESRMKTAPKKIAILGLSFKGNPPTSDMRGSMAYRLVEAIRQRYSDVELIGHDYLASDEDIESTQCTPESDVKNAIASANMIILQNNHPNYALESWQDILPSNALILDFWNQLANRKDIDQSCYFSFGSITHQK